MSENWLHISPTSGTGSTQMSISADTNTSGAIRKAKIIITAGTMSRTIDVVQMPTEGDIVCTYEVQSGSFKLCNSYTNITRMLVMAANGNTLSYTGTSVNDERDYGALLGVNEGDIITAYFYLSYNNELYPNIFAYGVPVKTIKLNEINFTMEISQANPPYPKSTPIFSNLPKLETIDFGNATDIYTHLTYIGPAYRGSWDYYYTLISNCPKLSGFTGDNPLVENNRTISKDGKLLGVALYGTEEYVIPSDITCVTYNCLNYTNYTAETKTIKSLVIPDSVTTINVIRYGNPVFINCNSLTSITMADSVVNLYDPNYYDSGKTDKMFQNCTALTKVNVSSGLTWGSYMFQNCVSLKELTIPSYVYLGYADGAFYGCSSLKSITAESSTAAIGVTQNTFYGIATGGTLYYPEGSDYSSWLSTNQYYLGYYH